MYALGNLQCCAQSQPAAKGIAHEVELVDTEARYRFSHGLPEILNGLRALIGWGVAEARHLEEEDAMLARKQLVRFVETQPAGAVKMDEWRAIASFEVADVKTI